ncbi:MAG: DUF2156 domain-containing protein [Synergistaceae bacterium]|nr:DUF2156 domain-containing protein [Synergistaceae bacterium]
MQLNFKNIEIEDIPVFTKYWLKTEQTNSGYCFPVLWGWASDFACQIAPEEKLNLLWINQTTPSPSILAPLGDWNQNDWAQIIADRFGKNVDFYFVPEKLLKIWQSQFGDSIEVEEFRGGWDYLYDIKKLATLSGNAYMKKRNRVNQFRKKYKYTYEEVTDKNTADVLEFQLAWCRANQCENIIGLKRECRAIQRILQNWNRIPNLCGGIIKVDGNIAAYSIGEVSGETLFVHFEKASLEYNSGYQIINRDFLSATLKKHPHLKIANREEDLNDPGMREAKMSYQPIGFGKEYHLKIKL